MILRCVVVGVLAGAAVPALAAPGDTLIGDPFILGYNGWVDPTPTDPGQSPTVDLGPKANWGIHLRTGALQESSDGRYGRGSTSTDGKYTPYLLVNDNYVTPSEYTLSATLATYDNDGFGLVFGFQDKSNYFRVALRKQARNYGFAQGVSVQKVWGNVPTQIAGPNTGFIPPISTTSPTPIKVDVKVSGTNWAVHINDNATPILSGTDANLAPGKVGIQSWYQRSNGTAYAEWGTEVMGISVSDASGMLFQDTFGMGASPVKWRPLAMTNSKGQQGGQAEDLGNFRLCFPKGTIADDTNGYEWATDVAPHVDFIGPAIVVDEPGSGAFSDYEMKVRMKNGDDDGIGLLLRVQDDDTFYRVNFALQAIDAGVQRAPQGLSIQKCKDGVWSELFRDDQLAPEFLFTNKTAEHEAVPFDVIVRAVGNQLFVQVIDDPDGAHVVHTYPIITDAADPILTGTVGFTNWGNGEADYGVSYSWFGGMAGTPLLVECDVIPEPVTVAMLAVGSLLLRRRHRN